MPKYLIKPTDTNPNIDMDAPINSVLNVSEIFYDTIQGEGINIGHPAVFLRLSQCTLNCHFCDTTEVWQQGCYYSFNELFKLFEVHHINIRLKNGHHLVITGGSPLLQQFQLINFLEQFKLYFGFSPYTEIENEAVLQVSPTLVQYIDCWNNSPKLSNSGNTEISMYKPKVIKQLSQFENSWFKFVITRKKDWNEVFAKFIKSNLILREQIILMPEGANKIDLENNREMVIDMAIEKNVKYCSREHIVVWDRATGV